ncbi:toxin-antitoxin system YwqK family antitoxin [Pseudomonas bijieensis]|jgi:antitoxin component YwqK of YwqJK toxin-antitoxin module|uniref:Toxin-antitoxin system YwqK family antitoxin n=1 Tax=Pseudomonas bijieensis TaxID=2681983 RepID=A0A6N1C8E1_9PSED|nr:MULTISPECIES: toxin-antitoxin system YwqK family antitoxin [Pseudomonas]QIB03444.1 toxin-antitoxin system YwqK family antitoxin [Pseudomonas fluorescens]MCD9114521.1 toxin-antitoxin system YwqK family antitoxin [Pseudomonas bijieensis]PWJ30038.1 MORN repeat protein [Pseudomonas sp. 43mfcvi1.1]QKS81484.1 toxin-antitoxin system YwqK family antitoxin [Pseudomonas bijieensis]UQI33558.1 toxin-antitoxin system YwqK family antitoxin [Pseudomonas bijieensis]
MASKKLDVERGDSQLSGQLVDGRLDGSLQIEEAQRPQAKLNYSQGELHGTSTLYHPNGRVSAVLPFVKGKLQGVASFYAAEGGLQRQATYRNGLLHGEANNYFPDGQLAEAEFYRDGVRDGRYRRLHPNGNPAVEARYLNGQLLEPAHAYAEDGRPLDAEGKPISRVRWWFRRWNDPAQA